MNLKINKINLDKETNSDIVYKQKQKNSMLTLMGKKQPNLSVKHNTFLYILRLKPQITITSNGSLVRSLFSQCYRIAIRKVLSVYIRVEQLNRCIFRKVLIKSKDIERLFRQASNCLMIFQAQLPRIIPIHI